MLTHCAQSWCHADALLLPSVLPAGSWLILEFDSRPDANAPAGNGNWASVYLSHLKSYEGMGSASVTCVQGCSCEKTVLDGTWEQQATLMQIHQFKVGREAGQRVGDAAWMENSCGWRHGRLRAAPLAG